MALSVLSGEQARLAGAIERARVAVLEDGVWPVDAGERS